MQFSNWEVYQTDGANKLVMSSVNKTGDMLWKKHGFLYKMSKDKIKAVFKIEMVPIIMAIDLMIVSFNKLIE